MAQDAARNALIESHLPLVSGIARRLHRSLPPWVQLDDMIQVGRLALVEAAERFEPRRGVTFAIFARYRIRGAIIDHLRTRCRYNAEVEFQDDVEILQSHEPPPDVCLLIAEQHQSIDGLMAQLPPVQRRVIALVMEGYTAPEIAGMTNSTPEAVYRASTRARSNLRKILGDRAA